jgi:hypothetical protein
MRCTLLQVCLGVPVSRPGWPAADLGHGEGGRSMFVITLQRWTHSSFVDSPLLLQLPKDCAIAHEASRHASAHACLIDAQNPNGCAAVRNPAPVGVFAGGREPADYFGQQRFHVRSLSASVSHLCQTLPLYGPLALPTALSLT